jgi:two-component system NarL family sensor kinase
MNTKVTTMRVAEDRVSVREGPRRARAEKNHRSLAGGAPRGGEAIIREVEAERRQLADRINDDPVQTLAHISRVLQSLDELRLTPAEAAHTAREAGLLAARVSEQLRGLARRLRPPLLDDVGLGPALRQLAVDFSAAAGIPTYAEPGDVVRVGLPEVDLVLFRVAQAALRNVEEHSAATRIEIRVHRRSARVTLTVRDNGIGLPAGSRRDRTGKGFLEMRERLRSVGGRLVVRSSAELGTVVSASVPGSPLP